MSLVICCSVPSFSSENKLRMRFCCMITWFKNTNGIYYNMENRRTLKEGSGTNCCSRNAGDDWNFTLGTFSHDLQGGSQGWSIETKVNLPEKNQETDWYPCSRLMNHFPPGMDSLVSHMKSRLLSWVVVLVMTINHVRLQWHAVCIWSKWGDHAVTMLALVSKQKVSAYLK